VEFQLGKRLAAFEAEIPDDEVAFGLTGPGPFAGCGWSVHCKRLLLSDDHRAAASRPHQYTLTTDHRKIL
jgi:hypothetical protein